MSRKLLIIGLCLVTLPLFAGPATPVPDLEEILARMVSAQQQSRARLRSYIVTRDYRIFDKDAENARTEIIASVSFLPPDQKTFAIEQSTGGFGERVVRHVLEHESQIAKDVTRAEYSPRNYQFSFVRYQDSADCRCFLLEITPRREDRDLMRGYLWVDADSYLVRRAEGEPAKSPSFWVKNVHFVLHYGEVNGMWLAKGSEATAHVRWRGSYNMVARDLECRAAETVAMSGPSAIEAQPRRQRPSQAYLTAPQSPHPPTAPSAAN